MNAPDIPRLRAKPTMKIRAAASSSASPPTACGAFSRIYFKALTGVPAVDIVAHRILWSLLFLALADLRSRAGGTSPAAFAEPKTLDARR